MKRIADTNEEKVVKVFSNDTDGPVEAILFKEVDQLGLTLGYVLHYVLSGVRVLDRDPDALISHYRNS